MEALFWSIHLYPNAKSNFKQICKLLLFLLPLKKRSLYALYIYSAFFMPPTLIKWGTYSFRLVRMYVCIHVRDIVLKLHIWIPHGKIADAYIWFSLKYLPLSNYGPLTNKGMKFCKCRISKSIIARNLKLVMLKGDDD